MMDDTATTPTPEPLAVSPAPDAVGPIAVPEAAAPSATTETADSERIGRFTRVELEALRGRRGRKPAEYYALFPEEGAAKPARATPPTAKGAPRRQPRISSAILGNHSIDELLAKAGSKGAKPPAYGILVAAAEHLVAIGAVEAPPIGDALARRVAEAPARTRRLIEAVLDATA